MAILVLSRLTNYQIWIGRVRLVWFTIGFTTFNSFTRRMNNREKQETLQWARRRRVIWFWKWQPLAATRVAASGRKWPQMAASILLSPADCLASHDWLSLTLDHCLSLTLPNHMVSECFSPPISNMCSSHPRCRNSEGSMLRSCILKQVAATCSHEFNCSLPRRCARPRCWISSVLRRILTRRCWRLLVGTWKLLRRFDAWTSLRALMTGWPQCSQWTSRIRDATRRKLTYQ